MASWTPLRTLRRGQWQGKVKLGQPMELGEITIIRISKTLEMEHKDYRFLKIIVLMILRTMILQILTHWRTGESLDKLTQIGSLIIKGRKR